jgi:hypothetical protein
MKTSVVLRWKWILSEGFRTYGEPETRKNKIVKPVKSPDGKSLVDETGRIIPSLRRHCELFGIPRSILNCKPRRESQNTTIGLFEGKKCLLASLIVQSSFNFRIFGCLYVIVDNYIHLRYGKGRQPA